MRHFAPSHSVEGRLEAARIYAVRTIPRSCSERSSSSASTSNASLSWAQRAIPPLNAARNRFPELRDTRACRAGPIAELYLARAPPEYTAHTHTSAYSCPREHRAQLALKDFADRGSLQHPVLERAVGRQFSHRKAELLVPTKVHQGIGRARNPAVMASVASPLMTQSNLTRLPQVPD